MRVVIACSLCDKYGAIVESFEFDEDEKDDIVLHCFCPNPECGHQAAVSLKDWLASIFDEEAEA